MSTLQTIPVISSPFKSTQVTWQRLLADSYKKPHDLLVDLGLPDYDVSADVLFATRVPKGFVKKMKYGDPNDPLLIQVLPKPEEFNVVEGFEPDPLNEQEYNKIPGLLHKYSSRVLLTLQGACAINCRYCFRRHFEYGDNRVRQSQLNDIVEYIKSQPAVNEIVLSGGDPLMTKDSQLQTIIQQFEALPQLKRLRIHTRLPIVIPERITDELALMLNNTRLKTVVVLHCNHANEIDENLHNHVQKLTSHGIHVLNQGVLLKDVNDSSDALVELSEKLFASNIMPYYLFLLDRVAGVAHFEVSEERARSLIREMASHLPGYLVPKLTRETPGLASKDMWV